MERAKSLFGNRDHDGYVGREEHSVRILIQYWQSLTADMETFTPTHRKAY